MLAGGGGGVGRGDNSTTAKKRGCLCLFLIASRTSRKRKQTAFHVSLRVTMHQPSCFLLKGKSHEIIRKKDGDFQRVGKEDSSMSKKEISFTFLYV
jgi:hypothetical protein